MKKTQFKVEDVVYDIISKESFSPDEITIPIVFFAKKL